MRPFSLEPYRPKRGLTNPHAQTVAAHLLRSDKGMTFRRERLDTPDGDFILLDYADVDGNTWRDLGDSAPIVLLLHGLEGHARRSYICETARQLAHFGFRSVGLNFRSCGGEMNRLGRSYHIGFTDDVTFIFDLLHKRYPDVAKGAVGFSLGGNVLLKYLGEQGGSAINRVAVAVAVSHPYDVAAGLDVFNHGSGRYYGQRFLKDLKAKALSKADLIADVVDLERMAQAQTVTEFDDVCTAPLWGFKDAADYYTQSSCIHYLPDICVPALTLRSLDDPFMGHDVPFQRVHDHPCLIPGFTTRGGHLGFVEGSAPWHTAFWAERQAARFLAQMLLG